MVQYQRDIQALSTKVLPLEQKPPLLVCLPEIQPLLNRHIAFDVVARLTGPDLIPRSVHAVLASRDNMVTSGEQRVVLANLRASHHLAVTPEAFLPVRPVLAPLALHGSPPRVFVVVPVDQKHDECQHKRHDDDSHKTPHINVPFLI